MAPRSALLVLLGLASAISSAPARPQVPTGVPQTIVLPAILIAGQPATLAVLDARGALVPAADVGLSNGAKVTTDDTGRAIFSAPPQTGILTARIIETGLDFTTTVLALPQGAPIDPPAANKTSSSPRLRYPRLIVLHDRFAIQGSGFSGDADFNRVVLNNLPALVLAASPVSLIVMPNPHVALGPAELMAGNAGSRPAPLSVTVLSLQVAGPPASLSGAEKSVLTVSVNGSSERLPVEVRNLSPDVVTLARGNVQRLSTSGGSLNIARVEFAAVKPGGYSVSARIGPMAHSPDIEAVRRQLLAARQLADPGWQTRLDRVIRRIEDDQQHFRETHPNRVTRLRQEFERLLRDRPQENVAAFLRLAAQSLGGG